MQLQQRSGEHLSECRLVGFGGTHLTKAVSERTGLPSEESEAVKTACGLLGEPLDVGIVVSHGGPLAVALERALGTARLAAAANVEDLRLIKSMTDLAVECALKGEAGVVGHDEEDGGRLKAIAFPRIAGGKSFDVHQDWFRALLDDIGQPFAPATS